MIPRTTLAVLTLSALVLAACGSDSDSGSGSAPNADDLAGQSFTSASVTGYELVADSEIALTFTADSISAQAGCNTQNGGYAITDGALEIGAMVSTMMACEDALMAQDTWLSEFLTSGPKIALEGESLTLTGSDATITLAGVQPTPLESTTWVVTGLVATEAVRTTPIDSRASLTITDGSAAIETGCNTGNAEVEVTDTTMTFGPIALTLMACEPELTDLEASVILVLDGEVAYQISGNTLSIRKAGADGEVGLELTAE